MNKSIVPKNQPENIKKAEKYIFKYINELKIHFNLSNQQLVRMLNNLTLKLKKDYKKNLNWKSIINIFQKK